MGLCRARIGSEHLGMESSGSRDFDESDHGDMGSSMRMYRRLTLWELGSLWSWECCDRDEGLEHGDMDGSAHETLECSEPVNVAMQL